MRDQNWLMNDPRQIAAGIVGAVAWGVTEVVDIAIWEQATDNWGAT